MADTITVTQAWDGVDLQLEQGSGSHDSSAATVYYIVSGTADETSACAKCYADAPAAYAGIAKKSVAVSERLTDTSWKIEVRYGNSGSSDSGSGDDDEDPTVNFDCGTGTFHRVSALAQTCVYAESGERESDAEAAAVPIGWNGQTDSESSATGVDVPNAVLRKTYTKWIRLSKMNASWERKIAGLVGKVNSSTFHGYHEGECMFMGCSYTAPMRGSVKAQVSFHFSIQLNENNAVVAGIRCGSKEGFEYLWAISGDAVENGKSVKKIRKIYKAVVCEKADFGDLGV